MDRTEKEANGGSEYFRLNLCPSLWKAEAAVVAVGVWESGVRTVGHLESRVAPRSRAGSFPTGDELQIRNPLYLTSVQTLSRRSDTDRTPAQAHEVH